MSQSHENHAPIQTDGFGWAMLGHYNRAVSTLERVEEGWLIELAARLLFVALLLTYYLGSALTKFDSGLLGLFPPSAGAFAQILPPIAEEYSYDVEAIPFFPWHLIVIAGTLAEIILPILLVLGLFTRLSALGMIGFVAVQTFVDVQFHGAALGGLFNNQSGELIDQRLLWAFLFLVMIVKGGGKVSIDHLLRRKKSANSSA